MPISCISRVRAEGRCRSRPFANVSVKAGRKAPRPVRDIGASSSAPRSSSSRRAAACRRMGIASRSCRRNALDTQRVRGAGRPRSSPPGPGQNRLRQRGSRARVDHRKSGELGEDLARGPRAVPVPGTGAHDDSRGDDPGLADRTSRLKLLGFSINTMTLFGCPRDGRRRRRLVVIENIEATSRVGKNALQGRRRDARGIARLVIGIGLVSVFVPANFLPA